MVAVIFIVVVGNYETIGKSLNVSFINFILLKQLPTSVEYNCSRYHDREVLLVLNLE